jgi:hypothetical protein
MRGKTVEPGFAVPAGWRSILWLPVLLVLALLFPPLMFLFVVLLFFILAAFDGSLSAPRAFAPAFRSCRIPFRSPPVSR